MGLVGFFGAGNYGDELFVEAFRQFLGGDLPLQTLLEWRPSGSLRFVQGRLRETDAIVIGGGDLLIPWARNDRYWRSEYLRRPVFVVGVGVPTWRREESAALERMRRFLCHPSVQMIVARDHESAEWIEQRMEPRVPVGAAADLVCALPFHEVEPPPGLPIIGVVTRHRPRAASPHGRQDDVSHVAALCRRAQERGYRVRQIILATGAVRAADRSVAGRLGVPDAELVESDDLSVLTNAIAECRLLATMKFHGAVVAWMSGVPAIALRTSDKNRNFFRRIGKPHLVRRFDDPRLPELLDAAEETISPAVRHELRADATEVLQNLRDRLLALCVAVCIFVTEMLDQLLATTET
jgi:polysaccharide pyruvyl transferase WcaK-like protein